MPNIQTNESQKQAPGPINDFWFLVSLALSFIFGLISISVLLYYLAGRRKPKASKDSSVISRTQSLPLVLPDTKMPASIIKTESGNSDKKNNGVFDFSEVNKRPGMGENNELYAIMFLGASIVINIIAILYQFSGDFLAPTDDARMATLFWAFSVVLAGLSVSFFAASSQKVKNKKGEIESKNQSLISRVFDSIRGFVINKTFLSLFPILLLAFILRVIPIMKHGLLVDEWYWLDNAKFILKGVVVSPFGLIGDQPSNLPAYPLTFLLVIVRNPLLAVRLIGVFYSLITICLVYLLVEKTLGFNAAICGALLMTVSAWDIHMSTAGWLNVNINPMLAAWILLFLYQIWEQKYTVWTLWGLAFLIAISVHLLYVAALLIFPVSLVLLIHWGKNRNGRMLKEIVLFGLFFFIFISPMIAKLIKYPSSVYRHSEFLQQNLEMSGAANTQLSYYWSQILLLGQDYIQGNVDFGRDGMWVITLDPVVQTLSALGILLIIIQVIRKKSNSFWLVVIFTFCIQLFVPFVLLFRTTSIWRAYIILPLVYLFTVYALVEISRLMELIVQKIIANQKKMSTIFLAASMALYFIINLYWFNQFFSGYIKAQDLYETTICQAAAKLIDRNVQKGSTIYMPDEMCFPLVSILYDEDQYHFIIVQLENPQTNWTTGDYVMVLNAWQYGDFNSDVQTLIRQKLDEQQTEMVTPPSTSLPVLYLIKQQ